MFYEGDILFPLAKSSVFWYSHLYMPNIRSAKKAMRVSSRKRVINDARRKTMKESVKQVKTLAKTSVDEAKKKLAKAFQAIDKAAKRGVIKKNTASRKKSRLSKALAK